MISFIYLSCSNSAHHTCSVGALFHIVPALKKVPTVTAIVWFTLPSCPCCTKCLSGTVSVYISTISTSTLSYLRTNVQFKVFIFSFANGQDTDFIISADAY